MSDILLRDPLSDVSRRERRSLLGVSAIAVAIVKTGLVPTKIAALGIEFSSADRASLFKVLAAVVLYFLVAFILYGASDFLAWRLTFHKAVEAAWAEKKAKAIDPSDVPPEFRPRRLFLFARSPLSFVRALFEFGLPIVVGLYAAWCLI
ncbi:MAG TPA: hypothetical protein VJZ25_01310 [Gemmatimonadaceae bacterium]|nr:hypothetical protein [Gemmatimonadaceae bacterium]